MIGSVTTHAGAVLVIANVNGVCIDECDEDRLYVWISVANNGFEAVEDDIQLELDRIGATSGVDGELERMKAELSGGGAPREIERGNGTPGTAQATTAPTEQPQAGDTQ